MATQRSFRIYSATDVIGGDVIDTRYQYEWLAVEPLAPDFSKPCFAVIALSGGGTPHLVWLEPSRQNGDGRFCKVGAPAQAISVKPFGWYFTRSNIGESIFLLGRLVDQERPPIATLSSLGLYTPRVAA